jgi:hypothetical protein
LAVERDRDIERGADRVGLHGSFSIG